MYAKKGSSAAQQFSRDNELMDMVMDFIGSGIARCCIFKPKIPSLVHFGRPWVDNFDNFGIFHSHSEFVSTLGYIVRPF
jgi:hypothetical protein